MALPSFHSAFVAASAAGNKRTGEQEEEERERLRAATTKIEEKERLQQECCMPPHSPPLYVDGRLHAVDFMSGVVIDVTGGSDGGYSSRSEPDSDFEYDFPGDGLAFYPAAVSSRVPSPHYPPHCTPSPSPPLSPDTASSLSSSLSSFSEEDEGVGGLQNLTRSFTVPTIPTPTNTTKSPPTPLHRHACQACERTFPHASQLEEHVRYRHSDVRRHPCPQCHKSFKTKSNLNQHVRGAHGGQTFSCQLCMNNKRFTASGYRYHLLSAHGQCGEGGKRQEHKCAECGKTFLQNKLLLKHVRSRHSAERNHRCSHCPAAFKRKDHLRRHVGRAHAKEELLHEFGDSVADADLDAVIDAIILGDGQNFPAAEVAEIPALCI